MPFLRATALAALLFACGALAAEAPKKPSPNDVPGNRPLCPRTARVDRCQWTCLNTSRHPCLARVPQSIAGATDHGSHVYTCTGTAHHVLRQRSRWRYLGQAAHARCASRVYDVVHFPSWAAVLSGCRKFNPRTHRAAKDSFFHTFVPRAAVCPDVPPDDKYTCVEQMECVPTLRTLLTVPCQLAWAVGSLAFDWHLTGCLNRSHYDEHVLCVVRL